MEAKIKLLTENLFTKTEKKEANWERIGKKDLFVLHLETGKILIDKLLTSKGEIVYQLSIINQNGDSIFNINAVKREEENDYAILRKLHESVKKSYFKVDETIEGLLGEVIKDGEIGNENDDLPF